MIRRFPSQLSLHYNGSLICGAGLIDAKWAITTAKCLEGKTMGLSVRGGSSRPESGGKVFNVSFVVDATFELRMYKLLYLGFITLLDDFDALQGIVRSLD